MLGRIGRLARARQHGGRGRELLLELRQLIGRQIVQCLALSAATDCGDRKPIQIVWAPGEAARPGRRSPPSDRPFARPARPRTRRRGRRIRPDTPATAGCIRSADSSRSSRLVLNDRPLTVIAMARTAPERTGHDQTVAAQRSAHSVTARQRRGEQRVVSVRSPFRGHASIPLPAMRCRASCLPNIPCCSAAIYPAQLARQRRIRASSVRSELLCSSVIRPAPQDPAPAARSWR